MLESELTLVILLHNRDFNSWVLYISTSVFWAKKLKNAKKSNKFRVKFSQKTGFLSLHQNAGRVLYSQKTAFSLKKPYFLPMNSCKSLLIWVIFGKYFTCPC